MGTRGWTSTHRWLLPIGNTGRVRRKAWPSLPSQPILSAGVSRRRARKESMNASGRRLPIERRGTELTHNVHLKKPAIGEVQLHVSAERALGSNGQHIPEDEPPDHPFRI